MNRLIIVLLTVAFTLTATAQNLKVMTYNIRYKNKHDGANKWDNRKDQVATIIKKADVAGLQEVLDVQLKDLENLLPGYTHIGVGRDNGKTKGEYSAIFYKKDKLDVLESGTFWLSDEPEKVGKKGWDAGLPRICTWAKFKYKANGQEFYMFNTHFDHKGTKARAESAKLVIAQIKAIAKGKPTIFTGDLNLTEDFEGYTTLVAKDNGVNLVDAFHLTSTKGEMNTDYGFDVSNKNGKKIDYIFTGPGWTVDSHTILTDHTGASYPSDHLPILAEMKL
jgi:endonuclease/exonuclease/phosphatase family metal-dependent hydrolase